MRSLRHPAVLVPLVVLALGAATACGAEPVVRPSPLAPSAGTSAPPTVSPVPAVLPTTTPGSASTAASTGAERSGPYAAALARTRDWLAAWARDGAFRSGRTYLEPEYRVTSPTAGPVLIGGRVVTFRPQEWTSADRFTLLVSLDLDFATSPGAWSQGRNDRFITFTRHSPGAPYLLALATGP